MNQLAEVLSCWRRSNDLGVREAAKMVGVTHSTFSRIENGKPMSGETMAIVLRWLLEDKRK